MPIEFECRNCLTTLRVPDESAGKQARCPKCSAVLPIPDLGSSVDDANQFSAPENRYKTEAAWNPVETAGKAGSFDTTNPNPYVASHTRPVYSQHSTSLPGTLVGAGTVLVIFSVLGMLFFVFGLIGSFIEMMERGGGPIGEDVISVIFLFGILVAQVVGLLGGIAMIRNRGWGVALAGTLLTMGWGIMCCLLPTLVAIFPLVVLMQSGCQDLMRGNRR